MRRIVLDQREEGFTLVELVVAMLIIGVVLVSVATVQVGTLQTNADNAARNTASSLANGAMEQFRSIPWNILRKGMASNYLAASGGDSLVSAGVLQVNGTNHTVVVAPSGASDQDITHEWLPLFTTTGSHTQVIDDPEGNGNTYRVKSYVTNNDAGVVGAVGLAVVVEWQRPGSAVIHFTSMFSSAYAPVGGCGDLDTAPFLTSCQPQYGSWSKTASLTVLVSAAEYDTGTGEVGAALPVVPGTTDGGINISGSLGRAAADSSQSTVVSATVEQAVSGVSPFGGTGTARIEGGSTKVSQASNNTADPHAPPAHGGVSSGTGAPASTGIYGSGESVSVDDDFGRLGSATASTTNQCTIYGSQKVPAGQPCAAATVARTWTTPLEATWMFDGGGQRLELVTSNASASEASVAWAGRFQLGGANGVAATGCTALSGAGCVSAGARSFVSTVYVGQMASPGWSGGQAPNGLVKVSGYLDTVLVQRGASQSATPGAITRDATIEVWNGTGYTPIDVGDHPEGMYDTASVHYNGANVTLTASATVSVSPPSQKTSGSACEVDSCKVEADAGMISVTLTIIVEPASGTPYILEALALINGSTGEAHFTEPVDV
jgi:prepilin-type N-terminal cleavage/methylation domain-containing protein